MLTADPKLPFAWSAVTFPKEGNVYFALRDPRVLRHTLLWISNGGRHYPPWNGRHTDVMGIEDATSYFHYGLAESARPPRYPDYGDVESQEAAVGPLSLRDGGDSARVRSRGGDRTG